MWRLVVQRLMDSFRFVPDPIERPADLRFRQRRVAGAVDFLRLVVPKEALNVGLVVGTLDAGVLQADAEGLRRLLEAMGDELTPPIHPAGSVYGTAGTRPPKRVAMASSS